MLSMSGDRRGSSIPFAVFTAGLLLNFAVAYRCVFANEIADEIKRSYVVHRDVLYRTVGDEQLLADVYRPDDNRVRPSVLMIHGGGWTFGDKWNLRDHARQLAQAGFVAVSINYRLAPKNVFPAQLEDCRAALQWIAASQDRWRVRTDRLAVWGYSAGGQLAALLATDRDQCCPALKAAVCGGAPCEFSFLQHDDRILAHVMGGSRAEVPHVYRLASPIEFASPDDCPMFLFHGEHDLLVPQLSSFSLYEKLTEHGIGAEYLVVQGYGHMVTFLHPQPRLRAIQFLKQHLE